MMVVLSSDLATVIALGGGFVTMFFDFKNLVIFLSAQLLEIHT